MRPGAHTRRPAELPTFLLLAGGQFTRWPPLRVVLRLAALLHLGDALDDGRVMAGLEVGG